jgi:hypothetical protein
VGHTIQAFFSALRVLQDACFAHVLLWHHNAQGLRCLPAHSHIGPMRGECMDACEAAEGGDNQQAPPNICDKMYGITCMFTVSLFAKLECVVIGIAKVGVQVVRLAYAMTACIFVELSLHAQECSCTADTAFVNI